MKKQNTRSEEIVFLNGNFLPANEAKLSILDPGFLCGLGLFETLRSYNGKIVYFNEHLKRLKSSCALLKIGFPYTILQLKKIIRETVRINSCFDAYIRLTLWTGEKKVNSLISVRKYSPYPQQKYQEGISLMVSKFKQADYFLSRLKTTNRILYEVSYNQAKDKGFDGAIILNSRGIIAESSRSNIFLAKGNILYTPSLPCGCLDGITRRVVFNLAKRFNIKIYDGNFTLCDLYNSDEVFLTNSLVGIMPVCYVEGKMISKGPESFKLTRFLMKKYRAILKR